MIEQPPTLYCVNHPQVETSLRCNQCERPICSKCAVRTPTGYRCPQCVRGQQKAFDTAQWYDYPLALMLSVLLSFLGSLLVPFVGFFTIFVAPIAGGVIAEVVRFAVRKRRSRRLFYLSAIAAILGGLPQALLQLVGIILVLSEGGFSGMGGLLPLIWHGIYALMVGSAVYYRLGGIQI